MKNRKNVMFRTTKEKVVKVIAVVAGVGLLVAGLVTGSVWCYAGAATCATIVGWCGIVPFI
jgi:hypothetical protein